VPNDDRGPSSRADLPQREQAAGSTVVVVRHRLALAAFVALVVVQLLAVYWPRVDVQGPVTWTDKVVHALLFLLPTVAGLLAGLRPAWLVGLLALHAPVSELVQHFLLPNRSGDAWDAVADLSGVVLGVTLVVVGTARRRW
jgi:VanZ family protein